MKILSHHRKPAIAQNLVNMQVWQTQCSSAAGSATSGTSAPGSLRTTKSGDTVCVVAETKNYGSSSSLVQVADSSAQGPRMIVTTGNCASGVIVGDANGNDLSPIIHFPQTTGVNVNINGGLDFITFTPGACSGLSLTEYACYNASSELILCPTDLLE